MKEYSKEARETLHQLFLDTYDGIEQRYSNELGNGYIYKDSEYSTVSAVFNALSYDEIQENCSVWTGIYTGAIDYADLEQYANNFAISIPPQAEYEELCENNDTVAATLYDDACQKVLKAVTDGLIDTWHSSHIARSIRAKKSA